MFEPLNSHIGNKALSRILLDAFSLKSLIFVKIPIGLLTYIIFFFGCAIGLWVIIFAKAEGRRKALWFLKILLAIKVLLSFADLLLLFLARPDQSGTMPFLGIRRFGAYIGNFFAGIISTYFGARWTPQTNRVKLELLIAPSVIDFDRLFRLTMALVFSWSGIVKLLYPALDARFFTFSGYSDSFLLFIALVEILGGLGLLLKKTAGVAAIILIADMAGAIFTHFHNHFVRNAPKPFANSLPALLILPFLISILAKGLSRKGFQESIG